jgi:hypothetical protein
MKHELDDILSRLPSDKKLSGEACEYLNKEIRRGVDLNVLQRDGVFALIQLCVDQGVKLPAPYESFWAYVYLEWGEEAKTSDEVKKKLAKVVQTIKANAALAPLVAQTVQAIQKERAARRQEMAKLAAALAESANRPARADKRTETARETPNAYVKMMQAARLGKGDNPTPNLELAVQYADEAVDAFPSSPKVLFEAAGCHQLLAETGTLHSAMVRYVHMKQANALYQQCLTILANQPYATLKGEYDQWRKGLTELILKVQKELEQLQEQQEREARYGL